MPTARRSRKFPKFTRGEPKLSQWVDVTSYTQGEKQRTPDAEPRALEYRTKNLIIALHRRHGDTEHWFVSCHRLGIDGHQLEYQALSFAKAAAISYVLEAATRLQNEVAAAFDKEGFPF